MTETLRGCLVALTGKFAKNRAEMERIIEAHGGVNTTTVDQYTMYLVSAYRPGNRKLEAARRYGTRIISETDFWHLVNGEIYQMSEEAREFHESLPGPAAELESKLAAQKKIDDKYDSYRRRLIYLRGYAAGRGWTETVKALHLIIDMHEGQMRNDGLPFASHPVMVAAHAVSLGISDDSFIAACLMHDVIEDTLVTVEELTGLKFSTQTLKLVVLMTKVDEATVESYFRRFKGHPDGMLLKILDRFHNMATMIGVFKPGRARRFIDETNEQVMPFFHELKKHPDIINPDPLYSLKYAMEGLVEAAEAFYPVSKTEE